MTTGTFRIARRVAPDRVISTVDPDARHGHKTSARSFDGYKGHVALDPDSELVTATARRRRATRVMPRAATELLADDLGRRRRRAAHRLWRCRLWLGRAARDARGRRCRAAHQGPASGRPGRPLHARPTSPSTPRPARSPAPPGRRYRCGRWRLAPWPASGRPARRCPLLARCTTDPRGRSIKVGPHEASLVRARRARHDPAWLADYRATRPKVERRIGHLMRRRHGGRRARVRGRPKVAADFSLLAAAVNLARLAVLGLSRRRSRLGRPGHLSGAGARMRLPAPRQGARAPSLSRSSTRSGESAPPCP